MTVSSTWNNPSTLDKATNAVLPSADFNKVLSCLYYLGGSTGGIGSGVLALTASSTNLAIDTAIASGAATTLLTLGLTAGTWDVTGAVTAANQSTAATVTVEAWLYDGTTDQVSGGISLVESGVGSISVRDRLSLGSSAIIALHAQAGSTLAQAKVAQINSLRAKATTLRAIKIG